MNKRYLSTALALTALIFTAGAHAEDYVLTLKDQQFAPKELQIPAGQKVKLIVKNLDATPAEFESTDLNREKFVTGHSEILVYIGPLDAGKYTYFNDIHRDTTGVIIVK